MGPDFTREYVESADLLLMLGATLNDVDTGIFTAQLDPARLIHASQDQVTIENVSSDAWWIAPPPVRRRTHEDARAISATSSAFWK